MSLIEVTGRLDGIHFRVQSRNSGSSFRIRSHGSQSYLDCIDSPRPGFREKSDTTSRQTETQKLRGGEHLCNRTSVPARSTPCTSNKRLLRPGQLCGDRGKAGGEDVVSDLLDNSTALGPYHLEVSPPLRECAVTLSNAM